MDILISNASGKPIYEQIAEQMKRQILLGTLRENDPLPSIRMLAKELRISVITTKRAYDELEREKFVYSVAGKGTYVARIQAEKLQKESFESVRVHLQKAVHEAKSAAISLDVLSKELDTIYHEEE